MSKRLTGLLFTLCLQFASFCQSLPDGEYLIKINETGKYFAIAGASRDNGAWMIQWDNEYTSHFRFIIKHLGNNVYTLKAKHSGKYLSTEGPPAAGAKLIQWDWLNQDNQKWYILPHQGGKGFVLSAYHNKMKVVLQNFNSSAKPVNGAYAFLQGDMYMRPMVLDFKKNETGETGGELFKDRQEGKIMTGGSGTSGASKILTDVPDGIYKIRINETGKYLAIAGQEDHQNGMRLIQWDMLPRNNHLFKVTRLDNGNYSIAAVHSEKVLDVVDMKTADGTPVQQWDNLNGSNQQWKFFRVGKESELSIISAATGKRLQLAGVLNATDNGHPLVIKENAGQTFQLIPARPQKFTEFITIRNLRLTVPTLGKDQEMCGQIKVHVINKNGQSRGSYYVTPNNILFDRNERNAYDISKTGILSIPGEFQFKITSDELVGSKIVITYGINENDASVFTTFGSVNTGITGDAVWVPDLTPLVYGGADDFYVLKHSFNDCLQSKLSPGKISNQQSFLITSIPPFCQVHVNMQDEDGSDDWMDVYYIITKERKAL